MLLRQTLTNKKVIISVSVVIGLAIIFRLILDPVASYFTRKSLKEIPGYTGDFSRLHISLFPLSYNIYDLAIHEAPVKENAKALVEIEALEAQLLFWDLWRATLGASIDIEGLKIVWTITKSLEEEINGKIHAVKKYVPINDLDELDDFLLEQIPFRFKRIQVKNSEFHLFDAREQTKPRIRLHHIESVVENFANREWLDSDQPSLVTMQGTLQKTGELSLFARIVPLTPKLNFSGQASLQSLPLNEIYSLLAAKTDLQVPEGYFDIFASLKVENSILFGGIKPRLRNIEIKPANDKVVAKIKAIAAQATAKLLESDEGKQEIIGAIIPIAGRVGDPKIQFTPTLLGILRNAFIEPLPEGYVELPPEKAKEKESIFKQIIQAFSKDKGQPKAQPETEKEQALPNSEKTTLHENSAEEIQTALRKFDSKAPSSGKMDKSTQKSLAKFQEDQGLAATGFPDRLTLKRLGLDPEDVLKDKEKLDERDVALAKEE